MGDKMSEKKDKKDNGYYFALCSGLGVTFGIIFDQLTIGLSLGVAFGIILDSKRK